MWVWVCEGLGRGGGERKGPRGEGGEGMKEKKEVECNGVRIEGNKRGVTQE